MLFNTIEFLFIFLPFALLMFYAPALFGCKHDLLQTVCLLILGAVSLVFYSWWDYHILPVIIISVVFNLGIGRVIESSRTHRFAWLFVGVAGNIAALAYCKYFNFLVSILSCVANSNIPPQDITLPLGISFFTFTQIAYLVDIRRRVFSHARLLDSAAVVLFFPHLVAGPILYHHEMLSQFTSSRFGRFNRRQFLIGMTVFTLGMFKKIVLADGLAKFGTEVFLAVSGGHLPNLGEAWRAALAYTLQLYFDFSGYSDMAVGLANMFGLRVPINFFSPYKATSIIDFWRRWHISLSIFLKKYLYISLGGSRHGLMRKYLNIGTVMIICGIWHGAGWTFIVWGAFHGVLLLMNHAWRDHLWPRVSSFCTSRVFDLACGLLTFLCVLVGWVIFQASDLHDAFIILKGMAGLNPHMARRIHGGGSELWIAAGLLMCWLTPNTQQIMRRFTIANDVPRLPEPRGWMRRLMWRPSMAYALAIGLLLVAEVDKIATSGHGPIFLYFQF